MIIRWLIVGQLKDSMMNHHRTKYLFHLELDSIILNNASNINLIQSQENFFHLRKMFPKKSSSVAGCNLLGHHLHVSLGNLVHQLLLHNNVDLADVLGELGRHRPFHGLQWKKRICEKGRGRFRHAGWVDYLSTQSKYLNKMLRLSCCSSSQFNGSGCPTHSKTRPTCGGRKAQNVVLLGFHWSTPPRERVRRCGASSLLRIKAENGEEDLSCCCDRVMSASLLCTVHKCSWGSSQRQRQTPRPRPR